MGEITGEEMKKALVKISDYCGSVDCENCAIYDFCKKNFRPGSGYPCSWDVEQIMSWAYA